MKYIVNNTKLFIVLGLLIFVFACAGTTNKPNTTATTATNGVKPANTPQIPVNAPVGATPPNLLGSPTAAVTVEEFADFQCGACASVHTIVKNVQAAYGSRIKFWDMQNQLFSNQKSWENSTSARDIFEGYAQNIGLDVEKFKTDMLGMATKSRVDADIQRGRALGVSSTPTIYINGVSVPFAQMNIDALKGLIDAELQKSPTQTQTVPTAPASANTSNANTKTSAANTDATTTKPASPVNKK